jgi:hypothetical protein
MLQVLVAVSQKFCCRKEVRDMQKLFIKKKKKLRKNGQVSEISKTIGTQMLAGKRRKDSPCSFAKIFSSVKREICY